MSALRNRLIELAQKIGRNDRILLERTAGVLVTAEKVNLVGAINEIALASGVSGTTVTSFNGRDGVVALLSADVVSALGFTPYSAANPSGFISSINSGAVITALGYTPTSITGLTGVQSASAIKTGLAFTKADVGLGSVDNTADNAKNVLSATKLTTARNINGVAFDGTGNITINAVDSTARVPETRTISTTAPLTGGGDLSANRTLAIPAATGAVDGYMTAAFATKLNGIAAGATVNDTDANLKARANHTGTQAPATITFAASGRFLGRNTAGGGAGEEITPAQAKTLLAIAAADVSGLSALATSADAANLTGTVAAGRLPAFTGGDVTSSAGTVNLTIGNGAVSLAKMANMATGSLIYRKTGGSGAPEVQTLATLKSDLGLTGTNSGDQTITLTGDVTGSGTGSFAASIASSVISAFGRTLTDDADAATARATLGLGTAATKNIHVGTSAPGSPAAGDLWVDTN